MNDLMKGDFYQTLITLILFDCILLLFVNLLKRKKKSIAPATPPTTPKTVDLNQFVKSDQYSEPVLVNKSPEYETIDAKITGKKICYYPTKDGEQPYSAYKLNYF